MYQWAWLFMYNSRVYTWALEVMSSLCCSPIDVSVSTGFFSQGSTNPGPPVEKYNGVKWCFISSCFQCPLDQYNRGLWELMYWKVWIFTVAWYFHEVLSHIWQVSMICLKEEWEPETSAIKLLLSCGTSSKFGFGRPTSSPHFRECLKLSSLIKPIIKAGSGEP